MGKSSNLRKMKMAVKSVADVQNRYRDLLSLYPQYAAVIQNFHSVLCNGKMLELAGRAEKELDSLAFADLTHPDDRRALGEMLQRVQEGESDLESANLRFLDPSGKITWLDIAITRIDWDTRPAGLFFAVENTARRLAEQEIQERHERLLSILNAVPDLMFEVDRGGQLYELPGTARNPLPMEATAGVMDGVRIAARTGQRTVSQYSVLREGKRRWFEHTVSALGDHHRADSHFLVLIRDITQRKGLEEQAAQGRVMDAIGRLAGGIAHDFNNILQAILGFCNLIRERADDGTEVLGCVGVIEDSAQRAASITHQLLAFSRKQAFQPVVRDMNDFLRNCEQSLRLRVGAKVELTLKPADQPMWVNVDPAQLQQVLLNLAENARDSIQESGRLTMEAHRVEMGPDAAGAPTGMPPGTYGLFLVQDTGMGMDSATLSRIFEPFFTTKDMGMGSGLGLSMVYGTVRQMGGFITADSVVGHGSSFRIYLPLIDETSGQASADASAPCGGSETILLVSEEDALRAMMALGLKASGYTVIEAAEGEEAMRVGLSQPRAIHLALIDGDTRKAEGIRASFADVPVIFLVDSTAMPLLPRSCMQETLLCKPFGLRELQVLVREVLDANASRRGRIVDSPWQSE
jgi:PAS domain S-box-containing protein